MIRALTRPECIRLGWECGTLLTDTTHPRLVEGSTDIDRPKVGEFWSSPPGEATFYRLTTVEESAELVARLERPIAQLDLFGGVEPQRMSGEEGLDERTVRRSDARYAGGCGGSSVVVM